jgi:hypothetical protein
MTSATVSVAVQKYRGDSTHPIGRDNGIPTSRGSPGSVGKRTAKDGACSISRGV